MDRSYLTGKKEELNATKERLFRFHPELITPVEFEAFRRQFIGEIEVHLIHIGMLENSYDQVDFLTDNINGVSRNG